MSRPLSFKGFLVRKHLAEGKTSHEIAKLLDVSFTMANYHKKLLDKAKEPKENDQV